MAAICSICGLPKDICVCGEIGKEQRRIRVRLDMKKWRRPVTIVEGLDESEMNLSNLARELKTYCACGGTAKNAQIILQGDHRERVKAVLIRMGYPEGNLEVQ